METRKWNFGDRKKVKVVSTTAGIKHWIMVVIEIFTIGEGPEEALGEGFVLELPAGHKEAMLAEPGDKGFITFTYRKNMGAFWDYSGKMLEPKPVGLGELHETLTNFRVGDLRLSVNQVTLLKEIILEMVGGTAFTDEPERMIRQAFDAGKNEEYLRDEQEGLEYLDRQQRMLKAFKGGNER